MLTWIPSSSLLFDPGRARAPSQSEGTPHGTSTEEFPPIKLSDGTYKHTQKHIPGSPESRFPTLRDIHTNTHGGADRLNNSQRCRELVERPVDVRRPLNSPPYELRLRRAFGLRSFDTYEESGPGCPFLLSQLIVADLAHDGSRKNIRMWNEADNDVFLPLPASGRNVKATETEEIQPLCLGDNG